ncbi:hypothetical protein [Chitinophaga sp. YIM B06452]|uniref:hypothetical protein n=1 Tax=Chitinophaga sp. YIM B06452 TaxID=3082158 RepID=UPI0031FE585E
MREIGYRVTFSQVKNVVVSEVSGAGGVWYVYIDNYYQGPVFKRRGEWVFEPQLPKDWLWEDMLIITQLVAEATGE